ncbi:MAG TPA: SDR family NAD(P)-dependent oxidoreductase [Ramlibacter sp.]|jgi:short-subunit dehydrogenase|uniref:SDR family NAD(P)-dependent oxidoreductase n=1 Tax=Ramlibacter sp. TaxID=1917967 RepID=UPI002D4389F2|nr:SDR family NAD(P)-dependent oxidoreductase [Ramlibacter sp.]HZY20283.1 SDR family NAD(P)-dependent oxidoreductase [Ramlibacter sp.]
MGRTNWQLSGGVAVVTGAASGIGAALARELAGRGMHLALVDVRAADLQAAAEKVRAAGILVSTHPLDVADRRAVAALPGRVLAVHRRVTVLVNNAGVALGGPFDQVAAEDFEWLMEVNFGAVVRLTRAFLPVLAREEAAQVVNVSSIFGIIAPPGQTAYCASKFAVRGFSESLRHELEAAESPVGVTLVHPGGVRTAIGDRARLPADAPADLVARERQRWQQLLTLPPEVAARTIAQAIARRAPRVLVGRDARQAALLQRLFPVRYWALAARDIARRARAAT